MGKKFSIFLRKDRKITLKVKQVDCLTPIPPFLFPVSKVSPLESYSLGKEFIDF